MMTRRWGMIVSVATLALMPAARGVARAQLVGAGAVSSGSIGFGYGSNLSNGYGPYGSYGYGVQTGQVGAGYRGAGQLYSPGFQRVGRPQTTISLGPLYSAITSVPGWYGPSTTHRARRRLHATRPVAPTTPPFDDDGKILWPSSLTPKTPGPGLRQDAEDAVRTVVRESKSTGHASIRPVIAAKTKLSAFERKVMPEVKAKNVADGDALDTFFFNLDNALDALTYTY